MFLCLILVIYLLFKKKPKFEIQNENNNIIGCINSNAYNFNPNANIDNGNCNFIKDKIKKKYKLYKIKDHYITNFKYNKNLQNISKVVSYKLIDKYNHIKNSKFSILNSFDNLFFDLYYDFNESLVVLNLLSTILVPNDFSDKLNLNSFNRELFFNKDKIILNNNRLILIHNNKEIFNIKVEYKIINILKLNNNIMPHNSKNNSINNDIIPSNSYDDNNNKNFI